MKAKYNRSLRVTPATGTQPDPIGERTASYNIHSRSTEALREHCSKCVLGLRFKGTRGYRTGVYVSLEKRSFVISAGHYLTDKHLTEIEAVARAEAPFVDSKDPRKDWQKVTRLAVPFRLHVRDARILLGAQDLLILRVDSLPDKDGYLQRFDLDSCSLRPPNPSEELMVVGYPESTAVAVRRYPQNNIQLRLSLHFHFTEIAKPSRLLNDYSPHWHFLLNLQAKKFGRPIQLSPGGMSGAPVWRMPESDGPVWTPSHAELVGVQTGIYDHSKLIKATRIRHAIIAARKML
jgi:hypothetical protein